MREWEAGDELDDAIAELWDHGFGLENREPGEPRKHHRYSRTFLSAFSLATETINPFYTFSLSMTMEPVPGKPYLRRCWRCTMEVSGTYEDKGWDAEGVAASPALAICRAFMDGRDPDGDWREIA